jgi:hypothetical protein
MPDLKLAKLPDRTPVKITFKALPDLVQMLNDYCAVYRAVYRQPDETVEELIPFMLAAFMETDPQFKKARKQALGTDNAVETETSAARNRRKSGKTAVPAAPTAMPPDPKDN